MVYVKKPFGSPVRVLEYLARYTHRVALSNDRICSLYNREVTFAYRNRKNEDRRKLMTLGAEEFIRRFLLDVIPKGFMRVRHYGTQDRRRTELEFADYQSRPRLPRRPKHKMG